MSTNATDFDLKAIQGVEQFLANKLVASGNYTQVRLEVKTVSIEGGGNTTNATVPSGELKLVGTFEVALNKTTVITLDFDGEKSVVATGEGKYEFKPVIKLLVDRPAGEKEAPPLDINTTSLPNSQVDTPYSADLLANGGKKPYVWTVSAGSLPGGLSLDAASGNVSGSANMTATFNFTVEVSDNSTPPLTDNQTFTVRIAATGALIITTSGLPGGDKDTDYSVALQAVGGTAPYTWSVAAGALPDGLTLADGTISGTPTKKGDFSFTVQVKDSAASPTTDSQPLSIHID